MKSNVIFLFAIFSTLLQISSCKKEDPLADVSQFTGTAGISPDFTYNANLCIFINPNPPAINPGRGFYLMRYNGEVIYDQTGRHFFADRRESLEFYINDVEIGCTDLNEQFLNPIPDQILQPANVTFSQVVVDQTGESYTFLRESGELNQVCITHIYADEQIIEGTFDLTVVLDTTTYLGREKIYAPWYPDTLRFRGGTFRARVAIDF